MMNYDVMYNNRLLTVNESKNNYLRFSFPYIWAILQRILSGYCIQYSLKVSIPLSKYHKYSARMQRISIRTYANL